MDDTTAFPVGFYIALAILVVASAFAWKLRDTGVGIPMLAVLATVGAWYFGDALYNDYQKYVMEIGALYLEAAWWQVALFIGAFAVMVPVVHRVVNRKMLAERSQFMNLMHHGGIENPEFQRRLDVAMGLVVGVWAVLMVIALIRTNFDFLGLFAPYISGRAYPWARGRIGGDLDALIAFAAYLQIMLTSAFGIIAAVSKNPRTRTLALICFALMFPTYMLGRARNVMIATFLPGLLAWVFLRVRGGAFVKIGILVGAFLVTEVWMKFVIDTRSGADVATVFREIGVGGVIDRVEDIEKKHEGLNMFGELGWINKFIEQGNFAVNYGQRYFAELVNVIPRGLWKDKPEIAIDYAIARGQLFAGAAADQAGVGATISTGMIGQGVTNFGTFFGVLSSALLMALWVAILARQDLKGEKMGRMLLFFIGLVLTFNLGRDITLITLYPFVFGYLMLTIWGQVNGEK
jgi:hypothetical protein